MLRTKLASSRTVRVCALGLATLTSIAIFTDTAEARRHHHRGGRHQVSTGGGYSPAFSSIMVDGNSGAVLSANSPDALRRPASLTKVMTLYLLFEKLESGKMSLDTEMNVSEYASEQAPTKLGLRPGQTLRVEDAIKGIVTRSANDAAVVIAEAVAGDEEDFAKQMTRKARALGMSRTVYRNANGLPNEEQLTTARDQATLGRAIQDRFPRYYRYFSTASFTFHGHAIKNHNHLVGSVEGVDGIKTGYTLASGFNLITSMRRGNRHMVGVVLGGRSGGSRDNIMRGLLADNFEKAATRRTVAAITERNPADANADVAEAEADVRPTQTIQINGAVQVASAAPDAGDTPIRAAAPVVKPSVISAATAALPPRVLPQTAQMPDPAPFTSGVIQTQQIAAIPGSFEPMKPVRVKTVQVKSGQFKMVSAGAAQSAPPVTSAISGRGDAAETSNSVVARAEMPVQPARHGTGHGLLGVLAVPGSASGNQAMAYADPSPRSAPQPLAVQQAGAIRPVASHSGWIIQVGALDSEGEAKVRLDAAREQARGLLGKADPFTEPVVGRGEKKLYRARFAGLDRDQAEAVCKALKRSEISCITIKN